MPAYEFFSDDQLVKDARDGEEGAWEALIRRHGQRLLAFFARMNGRNLKAAQQQWLELWSDLARQRPSLASGPRFSAVAFAQAAKAAIAAAPAQPARAAGDPSSLEARSGLLHAALAGLPARERAALCLCYFDNLPWDEAGHALNSSAADAKTLCASAYTRLSEALGPGFLSAGL
jgi:RNA polymerase sigma-70 factor (ECF subfamily)